MLEGGESKRMGREKALESDALLKRVTGLLGHVRDFGLSRLRGDDPSLDPLVDINTPEEHEKLEGRMGSPVIHRGQRGK